MEIIHHSTPRQSEPLNKTSKLISSCAYNSRHMKLCFYYHYTKMWNARYFGQNLRLALGNQRSPA